MAGTGIKIEINDRATEDIRAMGERSINISPLMAAIGNIGVESVLGNFNAEGRPEKWVAVKVPTGEKILSGTSRLQRNIDAVIAGNEVSIGTNVEYAAVHNFGFKGTVQVAAHKRTIRQAFGHEIASKEIDIGPFSRFVEMPQREFLDIQEDDLKEIDETGADFVAGQK